MAIQEIQNNEKGFSVRTKLNNMFAELYGFITSIFNTKADKTAVLLKDNTTEYVPTEDYHPATKKTVTDAISAISSSKIKDDANTDWVDTKFIDNQVTISSSQRSSNPNILAVRNGDVDKFNVLRDGSIVNTGAFKIGTYNALNIPTKEERKIIYMSGTPGEFIQEGLHICKNNTWIPIDTYFRRPSNLEKLYTQTGIKDLRIFDNAYGLTQIYLKNTNDTADYAGAVISLEGSGAEYTNYLALGKYGALFYITNWRGKGVIASDKNMILSSTNGTTGQIEFEVGGSMSAPTRRFVMENDGTLAALTANYENLVTSDNDIPNRKFVLNALNKSAKYYTTTVGSGGDFATHREAYAAGHRRVLQISNVTETASPNFNASESYEIKGSVLNGSWQWHCNYEYGTVQAGSPWILKLSNIQLLHQSSLTGALAYCQELWLDNSYVFVNRPTYEPFSLQPLKIVANRTNFVFPRLGIDFKLQGYTQPIGSDFKDCIFTYGTSLVENTVDCPLFDCNGGYHRFENIRFNGVRFSTSGGFSNNIKNIKNAYSSTFKNVYSVNQSENSFFIDNPYLFTESSGEGAHLMNPSIIENIGGNIRVLNNYIFDLPAKMRNIGEVYFTFDIAETYNEVFPNRNRHPEWSNIGTVYLTSLQANAIINCLKIENLALIPISINTSIKFQNSDFNTVQLNIDTYNVYFNQTTIENCSAGASSYFNLQNYCKFRGNTLKAYSSVFIFGDKNIVNDNSIETNSANIAFDAGSSNSMANNNILNVSPILAGTNNSINNNLIF